MPITLDEANLYADMVGAAHGLTREEIAAGQARARSALTGFRRLFESGQVGFPSLPFDLKLARAIQSFANSLSGSYDSVCLAGIGGSALGSWAIDCALRGPHPLQPAPSPKSPRLIVLDNVDPSLTSAALELLNPRRTLVLVIAKSGSTAETVSVFMILRHWLEKHLGPRARNRIIAVTTLGRGELYDLASREGYGTFPIPENVGGRFSVLSAVGLLPAALIGINIRKLLRGAAQMTQLCWLDDTRANPALRFALMHYLIWQLKGKTIHVVFPYSNRLWGAAFWFRQLWAESLGKARTRSGQELHTGQTPVAALGTTDQHSQVQLYMEGPNDKVFTFWAVRNPRHLGKIPRRKYGLDAFDYLAGRSLAELLEAERLSTAAALASHGRPNCAVQMDRLDEEHLGALLQMYEFATAFMGELLDINAFDQEGVELGKRFTFGLMGRPGFEAYRERFNDYEKRRKALER